MSSLKKGLIANTIIAIASGLLLGFILFYFTKNKMLTFTSAGLLWFVLQLSLTIKLLERHAGSEVNRFMN
jgi:hypothetical protein